MPKQSGDQVECFAKSVDWWTVQRYVTPVLERIGPCPLLGSPEWDQLPDDDVRKIGAIFDAAPHFALWVQLQQEALAQTSEDISRAADWRALARDVALGRGQAYIPKAC